VVLPLGSHITDDEIKHAEEKFAESLAHAQIGMHHLLSNDVSALPEISLFRAQIKIYFFNSQIEQISQLCTFAECMHEYHQQCTEILKDLVQQMQEK
jgi:endophilin-A